MIDLFSRMVVGWSLSNRIDTSLVSLALEKAYMKRMPEAGLLLHSDRGVQYTSESYRTLACRYGMVQSMSRRGNCWDNSVAESFFRSLKVEGIQGLTIASKKDAETIIFKYIEQFYNKTRIHSFLLYRSPAQWEADVLMNPGIIKLRNAKILHT